MHAKSVNFFAISAGLCNLGKNQIQMQKTKLMFHSANVEGEIEFYVSSIKLTNH